MVAGSRDRCWPKGSTRGAPKCSLASFARAFSATVLLVYVGWAVIYRATTHDAATDWRPNKAGIPRVVENVTAQDLESVPDVPDAIASAVLPALRLETVPVTSSDMISIEPPGAQADVGFAVVLRLTEFDPSGKLILDGEAASITVVLRAATGDLMFEALDPSGVATAALLVPWIPPDTGEPIEITMVQRDESTAFWVDRTSVGALPTGRLDGVSAVGWRTDQVLGASVGKVET